jgi:dihydroxyacetone kinase
VSSFAADAIVGFSDVYSEYVRAVPGGVIRAATTKPGKAAVVIGGGSGHYPAFAGYVGPGLADAAVLGDVFASPSTRQIVDVARRASRGAGVLLGFGNYAGDVLNFTTAAQQLAREGIPTNTIAVTDDVASAPATERTRRRGIAGDVVVFKIAGAAAERGYDLEGVTRVANASNDRTRSFGIAFGGCTLPGSSDPLFALPSGSMALGLGIHGEPGLAERPAAGAKELARILVSRLLVERPENTGRRVAALLNGLGSTKYEELFVLWRFVAPLIHKAGLEIVAPEVGEFVTSLDMAGCSLTLGWLDDELEELWLASSQSPAFRRGPTIKSVAAPQASVAGPEAAVWLEATLASRVGTRHITRILAKVLGAITKLEEDLGHLDAQAGDGDHGRAMVRGLKAACVAATAAERAGAGASSALTAGADAWADRAGGTSGALWGAALRAWAGEYSDSTAITVHSTVAGARAALEAVMRLGHARVGDKTMVDAFTPFVETLAGAVATGASLVEAWHNAAERAKQAADNTAELTPRLGRARPLAERSIGHRDAGAVSFALCAQAVDEEIARMGNCPRR